jgi:lysophospholipase L1-like esterase
VNERCVLFFGDSFVTGTGDEDGLGWPGRLVAAAWRTGLPMTAYNLGVRGENTRDVARRFRAEAEPRLIPGADNRAVFAVGANDVSLDAAGEQELSSDDSLRLMDEMLDACAELGITAMVLGPGPAGIPDHDERSRALGDRFGRLSAERGARYFGILDELLTSEAWAGSARRNDGLHPSAEGYAALARLLEPAWLEWLRVRPGD